jgi:hypothetical protein
MTGWTIHETVAPVVVNRKGTGWRWQLHRFLRWVLG